MSRWACFSCTSNANLYLCPIVVIWCRYYFLLTYYFLRKDADRWEEKLTITITSQASCMHCTLMVVASCQLAACTRQEPHLPAIMARNLFWLLCLITSRNERLSIRQHSLWPISAIDRSLKQRSFPEAKICKYSGEAFRLTFGQLACPADCQFIYYGRRCQLEGRKIDIAEMVETKCSLIEELINVSAVVRQSVSWRPTPLTLVRLGNAKKCL